MIWHENLRVAYVTFSQSEVKCPLLGCLLSGAGRQGLWIKKVTIVYVSLFKYDLQIILIFNIQTIGNTTTTLVKTWIPVAEQ